MIKITEQFSPRYQVAVIGGGHAGCEAALAAARMGMETILFAINLDSIAMMPCNPNIGGSAKGHLVCEIDALGGQMAKNTDACFLQSRMLNRSKGPAVYALRKQADKARYSRIMKQTLESEPNLTIRQNEVIEIITETSAGVSGGQDRITAVRTESGTVYECEAVIVCAGTYLRARCLYGETVTQCGPNGLRASNALSVCLEKLGFPVMRFKTGTPARVHKGSIDFSVLEEQPGDEIIVPFSFETDPAGIYREQIPCHLTYTNSRTHEVIRANLHRSPMYSGVIEGTGTRYCPSIEDKIVRFADKERHPVFIEPEGEDTAEMYIQGLSTSLPEDVQNALYRTVPGLENCVIMRNGYAIEYDCIDATGLKLSLEAKHMDGLFFAGQINGSSGYEEAAAQGLIAGINAALKLRGEEPLIIDRAEGYIGVLIDDLVTKGTREPYRMMTSRAEYRLLLRQDNADLRLTEKGYKLGLISEKRYARFLAKRAWIESEIKRVRQINVAPGSAVNEFLTAAGSAPVSSGVKLTELIKRPEISYESLLAADVDFGLSGAADLPEVLPEFILHTAREQVNIQIKYEGYIQMQLAQAEHFRKLENKPLPRGIIYDNIPGLRIEARQKLTALRPANIGQASRVSGVSPADINVLLVYLKAHPVK